MTSIDAGFVPEADPDLEALAEAKRADRAARQLAGAKKGAAMSRARSEAAAATAAENTARLVREAEEREGRQLAAWQARQDFYTRAVAAAADQPVPPPCPDWRCRNRPMDAVGYGVYECPNDHRYRTMVPRPARDFSGLPR